MPEYRSRTTTHGRNMAGARALWRATGMGDDDFEKPIVGIANAYSNLTPCNAGLCLRTPLQVNAPGLPCCNFLCCSRMWT